MTKSQDRRIVGLDALRFLAAVSVMLYHYTYRKANGGDPSLNTVELITRHGYMGVEVFFVISGFVVLWSAIGRSPRGFVRARVLRLYPEFWICVLLTAAVFRLTPGPFGTGLTIRDVVANLTMVPGYLGAKFVDDVYWTLAVEIKFYFLLWVMLLVGQLRNVEAWLYVWLIVSLIATMGEVGPVIRSIAVYPYGVLFASGGLFFLVYDSGWSLRRALGVLLGLGLASYHAVVIMPDFMDVVHVTAMGKVVAVGVIASTFSYFAVVGRHDVSESIARKAALAGALTYPLYLLHDLGRPLFLNSQSPPDEPAPVILAITFSLALAYAVMRVGTGVGRQALRRVWDRWVG